MPLLEVFVGEGVDMDEFRARLRVLAVDDDRVSLMLISKQLRLCKYKVTTVMHPEMALEMLKARRDCDDQFDLVITDVHMPGMDGFKLLELIGLEMDIPVIMLSANDTLSAMMKGIQHGARDYLVKPVRLEQLKRLCIHVVRKEKDDPSNYINNSNDKDGDQSENGANHTKKCLRKKKKDEDSAREDKENTSTPKRQRIQWSGDLHRKFVRVINHIGIDKAVPKKILEMMNVEGLTREHVASHLQKYRLYMKKLSDGTFRSNSPFTDETMWSEGNSININSPEHFKNNLEHGRYQPSLSFAGSSNSSNPFARMNSATTFGTHNLLPTQSVQLMTQRNLGIPLKDIGPAGYGGNIPQIDIPRSQVGLRNFTSIGNSNSNISFPSGASGSSFANISDGISSNPHKIFPSSTSRNSLLNISNSNSPMMTSVEPCHSPFKYYPSLIHGNLEGANRGIPFDNNDSFQSITDGEILPPSCNLSVESPGSAFPFDGLNGSINSKRIAMPSKFLDLQCGTIEVSSSQGNKCKINRLSRLVASCDQKYEFQNQMAALTRTSTPMAGFTEQVAPFNIESTTISSAMTNDKSTLCGASSAISTLPNIQMNKHIMLRQMLNGEGESGGLPEKGAIVDQQVIGDQLDNNNEFLTTTSVTHNEANDTLDDLFVDWLNQDVFKDGEVFMDGDWEFAP